MYIPLYSKVDDIFENISVKVAFFVKNTRNLDGGGWFEGSLSG